MRSGPREPGVEHLAADRVLKVLGRVLINLAVKLSEYVLEVRKKLSLKAFDQSVPLASQKFQWVVR
jgi:hypothetical protein